MTAKKVDGLTFIFPDGWEIAKFDDWDFYRNRFYKIHNGIKGVDILALSPDKKTLWMIEAKDFRFHRRKSLYHYMKKYGRKSLIHLQHFCQLV